MKFAWTPVLRRESQHFPSPRFTELAPVVAVSGSGESPLVAVAPFDRAVLSWNGEGNWRLEMRLLVNGVLTPYFLLGVLEGTRQRSASVSETSGMAEPVVSPTPVTLETDTLVVKGGQKATGFQVRAIGQGDLRALTVAHYRRDDRRYTERPAVAGAWRTTLPVPERTQRDVEEDRAIGGEVCSPTSVSMVLEYYGSRYRTIDVARAAFDPEGRLYGNWPCNTGVAARLLKSVGTGKAGWSAVVKMTGFDEMEREIAARRPVIMSHRWNRGDLTDAPVSRSNGHLIVVVGFTPNGDVVVNDPAAKPGMVRRVYRRRELFRTWQERGEGIAYLLHRL